MKKINEESLIEPFCENVSEYQCTRSQDLPRTVFCDGYVDAIRTSSLNKFKKIVAGNVNAIYRDNIYFIDIDDKKDWEYAEYVFKNKLKLQ